MLLTCCEDLLDSLRVTTERQDDVEMLRAVVWQRSRESYARRCPLRKANTPSLVFYCLFICQVLRANILQFWHGLII